jgi:hypothetical protein
MRCIVASDGGSISLLRLARSLLPRFGGGGRELMLFKMTGNNTVLNDSTFYTSLKYPARPR